MLQKMMKTNMKKNIALLLLYILLILCLGSCQKKDDERTIVMGTSIYPPFAHIGGIDGEEIIGFDIEIAKKIAHDMNKSLQIEVMDFENLITALQRKEIDIAMCAMTITDKRKLAIDFSTSYYKSSQVLLIKKENLDLFQNIQTKQELGENKILGVETGSTAHLLAQEIASSHNIVESLSIEDLTIKLFDESIEALIIDYQAANVLCKRYDKLTIVPMEFEIEYYGVAVKKGNRKLLDSINKTINNLINSGEYSQLVEKYINNYAID